VAILWERSIAGHHYQVRQAGRTRRLYTDNIFHTQYRPDRVLGGGYWDLLALPGLMAPEGSIKRVLLLGVGGGADVNGLAHGFRGFRIGQHQCRGAVRHQ